MTSLVSSGQYPIRPSLLVVDDEVDFAELIEAVGEAAGYTVFKVTDSTQFPLIYRSHIDVIVLDLSMPGVDGIELIRFLADNQSAQSLILVSGFDGQVLEAARDLAHNHGLSVLAALQKPINFGQLRELIISARHKQAAVLSKKEMRPSEAELRQAIADQAIVAFYQPKVSFDGRRLTGFEALARWRHSVNGMIPPDVFIPLAEESGLIEGVTNAVLSQAFVQCGRWRKEGRDAKIAVNISARVLTDLYLPERLLQLAAQSGIHPEAVVIELTESAVAEKLTTFLDILTRLRMKGFNLSIDDFGTGYSSLSRVHRLPFSELKIDQSFVRAAPTSKEARSIIESTIELARKLGLSLVAEGVENQECWDILESSGCDDAQGYLIAKPMPAHEVSGWCQAWERNAAKGE